MELLTLKTVFFFWGHHWGCHCFIFGGSKGFIGGAIFSVFGGVRARLGVPRFAFYVFLGVPLFDWGSHKNMKIWKMFFELIFFRENDEVLKLVLKHVFSIHNDKLSIWDIFTKIFSFFWKESVFQNFQQIAWTIFLRFCDPKYFSYEKMIIIIF